VGLLKGDLFLDAHTGSLVHLEGNASEISVGVFVEDSRESGLCGLWAVYSAVHLHSEAKATIVGRTIVDIYQRDYQVVPGVAQTARVAVPTE